MSTQDKVTLSAQERRQLASMQARLAAADPELAKVLRRHQGRRRNPPGAVPPEGWRRLPAELSRPWAGALLVVAGLALMLATFASMAWLSVLGAMATAAGLGLSALALERRRGLRSPELPAPRKTFR